MLSAVMPAPSRSAPSPRTWMQGGSLEAENSENVSEAPRTRDAEAPRTRDADDLDLEANGGTRFQQEASFSNRFCSTASSVATLSLDQLCAQAVIMQVNEYVCVCVRACVCV
jgi:hypothetical protein